MPDRQHLSQDLAAPWTGLPGPDSVWNNPGWPKACRQDLPGLSL